MHKKKYGKMTVNAWLNCELEQTNCMIGVAFGVVLTVCAILVRVWVGSPYRTILELGINDITPPVWVMTLLWTAAFFVNGCAAGMILAYRRGGNDADKYKGGLYFVLLSALELVWYPTLFASNLVFISVLECILILCLSVAATLTFYRVTKLCGMILLFHDVWLIYMLILNFAVLIHC